MYNVQLYGCSAAEAGNTSMADDEELINITSDDIGHDIMLEARVCSFLFCKSLAKR